MVIETVELGTVATLPLKAGMTGHGTYLLTEYSEREGSSGQLRLQLTLEDATGRVTAFVWPETRDSVVIPPLPCPVSVLACVQIFDNKPQLKVQCLAGLASHEVERATSLLPRHRCPEAVLPAFDRLARLESELPSPLNGFLREALLDPMVGIPFLKCRGSVQHHHAFVGGLLAHSTELLDLATEAARFLAPDDAWSPHLAQLGYLFHDLGKLRSVGEVRRPMYALAVRHEMVTIELLAPHLRWLELRDLRLATGLRAVFDHLATPFSARKIPRYVIAEIVATLDQWSAASHNRRDLASLLSPEQKRIDTSTAAHRFAHSSAQIAETRDAG
ncbi:MULTISPECIES: hypothetical protein [Hydrocarboniphaga]|uniref:hypothetical protein n=1 Tax=Hydrocarboniphaga TaxID=243627 RepID=UPI00058AD2D1|nr:MULTISPECIES: hypothetical protein [Hydrocarboniphaga]MDZ4078604.1 hypothetical protein [Hydrocarboniphaga sp.]